MAKKRMFSMQIVDSDAFLDLPASTQNLYFHLNMRADDDGFIGNAKRIMRDVRANDDDLRILLAKSFLVGFDGDIYVIKHWWIHNTLQKDRYHKTVYIDEKNMLNIKENKAYTLKENVADNKMLTKCYQNDNAVLDIGLDIDIDLDKELDIDKVKNNKRFIKPSIDDVSNYCLERNNNIDPQAFIDYYESVGWKVGNKPMKDWKACVRTWENKDRKQKPSKPNQVDWDNV